MQQQPSPTRRRILTVPVDQVDLAGALALVTGWLDDADSGLHHVVTVNPEFAMAARRDPVFKRVLWDSALSIADGVGITLAGRLLGIPTGPRITGVELVEGLAGLRHPRSRLFLLGSASGVAEEAGGRLRARFPAVVIAGTLPGSPARQDWPHIAALLKSTCSTVLLVAFGHPRQDLWIAEHHEELARLGIVVAVGVGGAFDYLSGRVPRAPRLVRRAGLEWLYRLIRQPWRWRRQLALPQFVALVVHERLTARR